MILHENRLLPFICNISDGAEFVGAELVVILFRDRVC